MDESNSESNTTTTSLIKININIPLEGEEKENFLNNNIDGEESVKVVELLRHSKAKRNFTSQTQSVKKGWRQYIGLLCALGSSVCLTFALLLVKLLPNYHPLGLSFHRHWGNVIPSIPIVLYYSTWKKQPIFDGVWPITENWSNVGGLVLRGMLGATAVVLRFLSLDYLTLADSTVINYSGPIFIIVISHFVLKEELSCVSILTGIFMLFGVVIISRPPFLTKSEFEIKNLIGICIIFGVIFCQSAVFILLRKIRKLHFSVMQLVFGTVGLIQCGIIALATGTLEFPRGFRDISLMIMLAGLSFIGQFLTIIALKFEDAGIIGLFRVADVLFSFLWTIIFLDVQPDLYSLIGGLIVCVGITITGFRKYLKTLPNDNKIQQRLWFILK